MAELTWHRPIKEGVARALLDIFSKGFYADKVVYFHLKENKKWGSRDRKRFAEAVYDISRWYRKLLAIHGTAWPQDDQAPALQHSLAMQLIDLWTQHQEELDSYQTKMGRASDESIPNWLDKLGEEELGSNWSQTLRELNRLAPVFIRTNFLKGKSAQALRSLLDLGIKAEAVNGTEGAIKLTDRANIFKSKPYLEGLIEVQDLHSQQIASWLKLEPGMRVIDACAGAGGKTLHIASLMQNRGKIVSMDISEKKLEELKKRVKRAGASNVETRVIDSTKVIKRLEGTADRLLLDVPCSGIGALRRHPDAKWKIKKSDLLKVREVQTEILKTYSEMVKPGGVMVYATCSIFPSENERQVEAFLAHSENQWELEGQKTFLPASGGGDGFFVARLRRLNLITK